MSRMTSFGDGAAAVYQADIDLYGGSDLVTIDKTFNDRGIPVPGTDTDGDGCSDGKELGDDATRGGRRDPNNGWDFFDTPDSAGARDSVISGGDIARLVSRFGTRGDPNGD